MAGGCGRAVTGGVGGGAPPGGSVTVRLEVVFVVATTPGPDIFVPGKVVDPVSPVGRAIVVEDSPPLAPVVVVVSSLLAQAPL